jgi:hypothetical protein
VSISDCVKEDVLPCQATFKSDLSSRAKIYLCYDDHAIAVVAVRFTLPSYECNIAMTARIILPLAFCLHGGPVGATQMKHAQEKPGEKTCAFMQQKHGDLIPTKATGIITVTQVTESF